ncbi:peptidoglycan editing factor PgeF [Pseudomonas sp. PS1]|uniref:Purine nucleoside phosphorylase n=1 Tax=Stutzerimonas marianensis TaxID=2929513 RepID=A0A9X1W6V0_9GAMM|nr:peptidoglycan editing factor PgeF [Pseudomonas marianensis]MCJ0975390.1 peptidoglycan editing factor PgeF [Pseudomonas marianensis]
MTSWPADWLVPAWPAPHRVRACVTTRDGGVSQAPFEAFNLGDHVGDDPQAVAANRQRLQDTLGRAPAWLKQVHSTVVVRAEAGACPEADASWADELGVACAVLTADCLPVLFCDREGSQVAAAHAGWRGLAGGILEETVTAMAVEPGRLMAWLGPAIGPGAFEVGGEVRDAFVASHPAALQAFTPSHNDGRYMADLYCLARIRLAACGVAAVYGGGFCTYREPRFYSYRRAPSTGRFASLIWLE